MFRRLVVISAMAVLCFVMTGCYSVNVCAPADANVSLAADSKPAAFKKELKNWYVLWGLVPISNAEDGVSRVIKDNGLTEVRAETKKTFVDWLISYFLGAVTIQTNTTIIEGNAN